MSTPCLFRRRLPGAEKSVCRCVSDPRCSLLPERTKGPLEWALFCWSARNLGAEAGTGLGFWPCVDA